MFVAALVTRAKRWKQTKCPSADEWANKIWHVHRMGYYSVLKERFLSHAIVMNLEDIQLSEISHPPPNKCSMIPLL